MSISCLRSILLALVCNLIVHVPTSFKAAVWGIRGICCSSWSLNPKLTRGYQSWPPDRNLDSHSPSTCIPLHLISSHNSTFTLQIKSSILKTSIYFKLTVPILMYPTSFFFSLPALPTSSSTNASADHQSSHYKKPYYKEIFFFILSCMWGWRKKDFNGGTIIPMLNTFEISKNKLHPLPSAENVERRW